MRLAHWLKRQLSDRKTKRIQCVSPQSSFLLESLEPRLLLSAAPVPTAEMPATEPVVSAAVVMTDKADYSPGETAVITTSNTDQEGAKFGEGEMVEFQVTRTDGVPDYPMGNLPWFVTDGAGGFEAYQEYDATGQAVDRNGDGMADWIRPDNDLTVNGSISTTWFVEDQYLGASLQLTATGQTIRRSGHDAVHRQWINCHSYVQPGHCARRQRSHADGDQHVERQWRYAQYRLDPSGGAHRRDRIRYTHRGSDLISNGVVRLWSYDAANSTSTLLKFKAASNNPDDINPTTGTVAMTFTVNGATSGSNAFTTTAYSGISYNGTVFGALSPTVTVTAPVATTTTVSSSANPSTYGNAVTFTAIVTAASGIAAPTGSVEFFDGAISLGTDSLANSTGTGTSTWSITDLYTQCGNPFIHPRGLHGHRKLH